MYFSYIKLHISSGKITTFILTPKNNIVDITNYVLHELGQPLHAFDAEKIEGNKVVVKTLKSGTKFTTLDGIERELHSEDIMICDAALNPLCIAGVFGGINSGVTEKTTSIFLESAYFNPVSVRKTAKRHTLSTDASFRFERGVDPSITEYALKRAALLIQEVAGGEITSDIIDFYPKKIEDFQVFLNFDKANALIGQKIEKETIKNILSSLEIKVNNVTETGIGMTIPAYRNDVTREADVIEEILRVYGYNNIGVSSKLNASIASSVGVKDHQVQNKVASQLTSLGFHEMLNNSLTSPKYTQLSDTLKEQHSVTILNPLSNELSVMRQSMLFGALESLAYNTKRKAANVKLFEFGNTYKNFETTREEQKHLSLVVAGNKTENTWSSQIGSADFFYFKGVITAILDRLGLSLFSEKEIESDLFSEGLSLCLKKQTLVSFGVVNQKITKHFGVDTEVLFADFHWGTILSLLNTNNFIVKPLSKFPKVKRDFALLIDESVGFGDLKNTAFQTEKSLLKEVHLFDVYTGKNLPEGKKSYALSFTLQDENKTLTDKQIDKIMNKLQQRFEKDFGATLR